MEILNSIVKILELVVAITASVITLITIIKAFIKGASEADVLRMIHTYCLEAEETWGAGMGNAKFAEVVSRLHNSLPALVQMAYSLKKIEKLVNKTIQEYGIQTVGEPDDN